MLCGPALGIVADEIPDVVDTFPASAGNFGAYIVSLMETTGSNVLVVNILQGQCRVTKPLGLLLPLLEKLGEVGIVLGTSFSVNLYRNRIDGKEAEATEQSLGAEHMYFITLKRFTIAAGPEQGMHPRKPVWRELMDEMATDATEEYRPRPIILCK